MLQNKTLLAVISSASANDALRRHWPYFKLAGVDMLGAGTSDGKTEFPDNIPALHTGQMGVKKVLTGTAIYGLLMQEVDLLKHFLSTDYQSLCVVEWDNLMVRPLPPHPGELYLVNMVPNFHPKHVFSTNVYFSTPRWADRWTARQLFNTAKDMIVNGDVEHWSSDRFFAAVAYRAKVRFQHLPSYTQLPLMPDGEDENDAFIRDARAAIEMGAYSIHGVKTSDQLKRITEGLVTL